MSESSHSHLVAKDKGIYRKHRFSGEVSQVKETQG